MKNTKSKLSLDQFKAKLGKTTESLDLISGGILGACHDEPKRNYDHKVDGKQLEDDMDF